MHIDIFLYIHYVVHTAGMHTGGREGGEGREGGGGEGGEGGEAPPPLTSGQI